MAKRLGYDLPLYPRLRYPDNCRDGLASPPSPRLRPGKDIPSTLTLTLTLKLLPFKYPKMGRARFVLYCTFAITRDGELLVPNSHQ